MEEIFQIQLQKENDTALYQQLAEGIMDLITDGYLPANSKLPPIRKMAQHFGVNSVTIVSAYKYLESKQTNTTIPSKKFKGLQTAEW